MGLFSTLGLSRKAAENMSEVGKQHAEFAQIAYAPPHARPANMNGYKYVKEMSDDRTALYVNDATKQVEMSFRGSVDERDWLISDMAIAMDIKGFDRTFRGDERLYQQVTKQYEGYGVQTTGHSLGGARSDYLARKHNLQGHTYNLGARPTMTGVVDKMRCLNPFNKPGFCDNITHHHNFGDPISASVLFKAGKTHRYAPGGDNPGAIHGIQDSVGTVEDIQRKYDNTAAERRQRYRDRYEMPAARAWYREHQSDSRDWSDLSQDAQRAYIVELQLRDDDD